MRLTDPYGHLYAYDGETIVIEGSLSKEHLDGCHEAAGIPAPPYDPDRAELSIDAPGAREAAQVRGYLREHRIDHRSELAVAYNPDSPTARELTQLLERLRRAPVFPGALETAALAPPVAGDVAAVEALHQRVGAEQAAAYLEDAQSREASAIELIALAERLEIDEDALDEAVHDSYSSEASDINNGGLETQIRHLVETNNAEVARDLIEQAAR